MKSYTLRIPEYDGSWEKCCAMYAVRGIVVTFLDPIEWDVTVTGVRFTIDENDQIIDRILKICDDGKLNVKLQ